MAIVPIPGTPNPDDFTFGAGQFAGNLLTGNDTVTFTGPAEVTVSGGNGDDFFNFTDTFHTGAGFASIFGNQGNDTIHMPDGSFVTAFGGQGNDSIDIND